MTPMATITEGLAAHLRAESARRNISHTLIAERLGISRAGVSRRMLGHVPIDVPELYALAELLDMPVTELLPEKAAS